MATEAVAIRTNGMKPLNNKPPEDVEYDRILSLRGEVLTETHPRLKAPVESLKQGMNRSVGMPTSMASPRMQNGVNKLPQANHTIPTISGNPPVSALQPSISKHNSPHMQCTPASAPASSGLHPIFLTKSDVLVRAELQQKRQRIERALEEQFKQKMVISRQRGLDQDSLPDFDTTNVLREAQQIVKPINLVETNGANRPVSSSDSFDENTFYSSQMNDSATEEVDESVKSRPKRVCRFFFDGHCREGDACTFSHDPALKQRVGAVRLEAMDIDSVNADEQAPLRTNDNLHPASINDNRNASPTSQHEISRLKHIEFLEAQLRSLKSGVGGDLPNPIKEHSNNRPNPTEPAYPSLNTGDLVMVRQNGENGGKDNRGPGKGKQNNPSESNALTKLDNISREYVRRDQNPRSPPPREVRVVRNHITSPVAPQPARVSPLAVAKVPNIHQGQRAAPDRYRPSRNSGGEISSARQSPRAPLQPLNPKKRRRGIDPQERGRNVMPRRDVGSPEVRVKTEPVSPQPVAVSSETWQPRPRQVASRIIYLENDSPRYGDQDQTNHEPRTADRGPQRFLTEEGRPFTPAARHVISRNGNSISAHEEQDLRRVVSARQIRIPLSPLEQFAPPQPSSGRAASQIYLPQPSQPMTLVRRASAQPQPIPYVDRDRSFSPLPRARFSPTIRGPITMAPPARRVVVDQYGHRYEAPPPSDRQTSLIPIGRAAEVIPRYEQLVPHSPSFRETQVVNIYDERRFIRRAQSPPPPQYVEYHPTSTSRHVLDRESNQYYGEEVYIPRNDGVRAMDYGEPRSTGHYEGIMRPREGIVRTESVRPVAVGPYEEPREQIARLQSVRPEQDRVINLERRREVIPLRQVNVRADDAFGFAETERPKYRYATEAQERRYVNEISDDVVYEAPRSTGRRPLQRL